jgi:hypothetical protein
MRNGVMHMRVVCHQRTATNDKCLRVCKLYISETLLICHGTRPTSHRLCCTEGNITMAVSCDGQAKHQVQAKACSGLQHDMLHKYDT